MQAKSALREPLPRAQNDTRHHRQASLALHSGGASREGQTALARYHALRSQAGALLRSRSGPSDATKCDYPHSVCSFTSQQTNPSTWSEFQPTPCVQFCVLITDIEQYAWNKDDESLQNKANEPCIFPLDALCQTWASTSYARARHTGTEQVHARVAERRLSRRGGPVTRHRRGCERAPTA